MRWPPDKRRGPPGGSGPSSRSIATDQSDGSDPNLEIPLSQLRHRPLGPGELAALRIIFWNQAALGHRLPAELDIIVIEGGAS